MEFNQRRKEGVCCCPEMQNKGNILMIMRVWEVYKRDSQECCMFLTHELAKKQRVYEEVDLVGSANVDLTYSEINTLLHGQHVWGE
jgi:hypothetical protein